MIKQAFIGTFLAAALSAGAAMAEGGYIGAGGSSLLVGDLPDATPIDLNDPNAVGSFGAVGYRWDNVFSTEIEGGLRARSFDGAAEAETGRGGQEATKVLMVNARFAPTTRGALKPYAGVGAGLALVSSQDHSLRSDRDNVAPAGQALAGFALEVSDRTSIFADYRYFKMMESAPSGQTSARDQSHAGFIGLRVRLGDLKR